MADCDQVGLSEIAYKPIIKVFYQKQKSAEYNLSFLFVIMMLRWYSVLGLCVSVL